MKALALSVAAVLAFGAGSAVGVLYDAPRASAAVNLPSVASSTLPDALSACAHAYGASSDTADAFAFTDCTNAAYAYFYGPGWHSKLWNA